MLVAEGKLWSRKVTDKLTKRAEKLRPHRVDPYGSDLGDYKVIQYGETLSSGDYKNFKYNVNIKEGSMLKCDCLKLNLTGIPCSHVLAVIKVRKLELNQFVCLFYCANTLLRTWSGRLYLHPNQIDWPEYNGPDIIPERRLNRKGRRKHIRILMVMDEMQGRRGKHGSRLINFGGGRGRLKSRPKYCSKKIVRIACISYHCMYCNLLSRSYTPVMGTNR
jgi:SWIM zinc finger